MNTRYLPYVLLVAAFVSGCSDNNRPRQTVAAPPPAPEPPPVVEPPPSVPPMSVAGTWYSKAQVNAVNCGMGETVDAKTIVITQVEASIEMHVSTGDVFEGTVNGDIVEWTGSYAERGGMSDYTTATLVFTTDTAAGDAAWTWSDGTDSCNGTMAFDVAKDRVVNESPSNSWPSIADPVVFEDGAAYLTGTLGVGGDEDDFFKLTLAEDATIQAELSHFDTSAVDLDLILLDADLNDVAVSSSPDQFEMVEAAVTAGDYYLHVNPITITGAQSYHLTIDLN